MARPTRPTSDAGSVSSGGTRTARATSPRSSSSCETCWAVAATRLSGRRLRSTSARDAKTVTPMASRDSTPPSPISWTMQCGRPHQRHADHEAAAISGRRSSGCDVAGLHPIAPHAGDRRPCAASCRRESAAAEPAASSESWRTRPASPSRPLLDVCPGVADRDEQVSICWPGSSSPPPGPPFARAGSALNRPMAESSWRSTWPTSSYVWRERSRSSSTATSATSPVTQDQLPAQSA